MVEEKIGEVFKFFPRPLVAAVDLSGGGLKVGDTIHLLGHTTDFTQSVESMQVDGNEIAEAAKGDKVGLQVIGRVRPSDRVYKVVGD